MGIVQEVYKDKYDKVSYRKEPSHIILNKEGMCEI